MKKLITLLVVSLMLITCATTLTACATTQTALINSYLYEFMGLSSVDEVNRAVIVYEDGKSVELEQEDTKQLINLHWDAGATVAIQPYNFHDNNVYVNFYTKNNSFTVYSYGSDILMGSLGEHNNIWYFTNMGNRRNAIRQKYEELYNKYFDKAISQGEKPIIPSEDYLNLPKHDWAITEVQQAANNNILPYEIADDYESDISRIDFCTLTTQMLAEITTPGVSSTLINEYDIFNKLNKDINASYQEVSFDDFDNTPDSISLLVQLKIIDGRGDNTFDPDAKITREEAAKILCNTAKCFVDLSSEPYRFSDANEISEWATPFVDWVASNKIMNGTGNDIFAPKENYTREQAIATILRVYNLIAPSFQ